MFMNLTRIVEFYSLYSLDRSNNEMRTMGYDYKMHITVNGKVNKETGIVVNIVHIDEAVKCILEQVDGKVLDREVEFFSDHTPSLENLLIFFWKGLQGVLPDVKLSKIMIQQSPFLFGEIKEDIEMNVYLTKIFHFSAAHRLHSHYLNEKENIELFGKCNNYYGHGHNYKLEVTVKGRPDPRTGTVAHYGELERIIHENIINLFDHKHINADLDKFKDVNPTSEMVLYFIWDMIADKIPNLYKIGIWETEKNYFEYYGPDHT